MEERAERRQQRLDFLTQLYEKVDASVSQFVSAFDIAAALHIAPAQCTAIIEYLQEKKYIHIDDHQQGSSGLRQRESTGSRAAPAREAKADSRGMLYAPWQRQTHSSYLPKWSSSHVFARSVKGQLTFAVACPFPHLTPGERR